jgi:hypothetical protein
MAFDYAAKIGRLIAMAEDESLPQVARDSYRSKAEQMMREYQIAEEDAIATESSVAVPILDKLTIMENSAWSNPLRGHYWGLWSQISHFCGVRTKGLYTSGPNGEQQLIAQVVGYEGDVKYAEMIYTAARLVFMARIDARVDRSLTDQENCYFMRNSGMRRNNIATRLWGSDPKDGAAHGKVQRLYLAECAKRGETPRVSGRGIQVDVYREAYARAFVSEFGWRMLAARDASDAASGGALVLHGRKERVNEAFYAEFPQARPKSAEERAAEWDLQQAEEAACEDCKKTKSASGKCKQHRPTEINAAQRERYERRYNSAEARAGERSGRAAAADVHLSRTSPRAQRAEAAPQQAEIGSSNA